jgi:hypothetical protein
MVVSTVKAKEKMGEKRSGYVCVCVCVCFGGYKKKESEGEGCICIFVGIAGRSRVLLRVTLR